MDNTEILQRTLNATLERIARQSMNYESEIANLNAQIVMLQAQIAENEAPAEKPRASKAADTKES